MFQSNVLRCVVSHQLDQVFALIIIVDETLVHHFKLDMNKKEEEEDCQRYSISFIKCSWDIRKISFITILVKLLP